jgi:hypothetical protein
MDESRAQCDGAVMGTALFELFNPGSCAFSPCQAPMSVTQPAPTPASSTKRGPFSSPPWRLGAILLVALVLVILAVTGLRHFTDELTLSDTSFVRDPSGKSVKVVGFATNRSHRFVTMAVVEVSFLMEDGQVFTPEGHFVIDVFAQPGETFPFHTGWENLPEFSRVKSLRFVKFLSVDRVPNPGFWEDQSSKRGEIEVTSLMPKKEGGTIGFKGELKTSLPEVTSVHIVFACYNVNGILYDVQSWTVRPKKAASPGDGRFTFITGGAKTDPQIAPARIRAYVQHFETPGNPRPGDLAPEPSVQ